MFFFVTWHTSSALSQINCIDWIRFCSVLIKAERKAAELKPLEMKLYFGQLVVRNSGLEKKFRILILRPGLKRKKLLSSFFSPWKIGQTVRYQHRYTFWIHFTKFISLNPGTMVHGLSGTMVHGGMRIISNRDGDELLFLVLVGPKLCSWMRMHEMMKSPVPPLKIKCHILKNINFRKDMNYIKWILASY